MLNSLDYLFKSPKKRVDKFFADVFENEFREDLRHIAQWIAKSEREPECALEKELWFNLSRKKYGGEYPHAYRDLPPHFKKEYEGIRARVNGILWLDSLVRNNNPRSKTYLHAYRKLRREVEKILSD